ncbi:MAG: hypothetical protein WCG19_07730 [Chlorobiaceae bacterium]
MVRFILVLVFIFLVVRMVVRFFVTGSSKRQERSGGAFSSGKNIEEADYEVIESSLNDGEPGVHK